MGPTWHRVATMTRLRSPTKALRVCQSPRMPRYGWASGEDGVLWDDAPCIDKEIDGHRVEVAGQFVLLDRGAYSFDVTGTVDLEHELVIDPDLAWSAYLGGDT